MSRIRIVALFGAVALVSLLGCGGKSNANGATGGVGGATAIGGSSAGGAVSFTCTEAGATRLIGGVRFRCANGAWTPVSECMMGGDVTGCCGGHSPMKSVDVATDPCLVPFPDVMDNGAGACTKGGMCNDVECGAIDTPETRKAELDLDGQCIATSECQHSTDCVVAVNHLACCACPEPFPKEMLAGEPCITELDAAPDTECELCAAACIACPAPRDTTPRCIPNGSGIRACAYASDAIDCAPQDAVGLYPDPPGGACLPAMWTWNGTACVAFEGCLCSGTDCGALFASPEACLVQYRACGAVCVPGMDQTCNEDPVISSFAGHCEADGTCTCPPGRTYVQASGRCL